MKAILFLLLVFVLAPSPARAEIPHPFKFRERLKFLQKSDGIDTSLFIDPLPLIPRIKIPKSQKNLTLTMKQMSQVFYRDLPPSPVYGFNGSFPGPTLEIERDQELEVFWKNELPFEHLIPGHDEHLMNGATQGLPKVRTSIHLHGAAVPEAPEQDRFHNNDGWPDLWITPGETQIARYPNRQSARQLWYHDHAMGLTARNVVAGLYGMLLIRDEKERALNLPSGDYEIPLAFDTKDFNDDGTLTYPEVMSGEVYGSTIPVNGKICPYLQVEPRKYRFRMLNAASARSFAFKLLDTETEAPGPALVQIGSDAGFLEAPAIAERLKLSPAERADVIIDFSNFKGRTLLLHNNAVSLAGEGDLYLPNVMLFKVDLPLRSKDNTRIPPRLSKVAKPKPEEARETRRIVLDQVLTPGVPPVMLINNKIWDDPIEDFPKLGSSEVWEVVNPLPDTHPFHLHLVDFQVLDRESFDREEYHRSKRILPQGEPLIPEPFERGFKDTVTLYPGTITRIIAKFGPYPGKYIYHCHILEHEDMGMMRPFEVVR